jgi:TonB family protein
MIIGGLAWGLVACGGGQQQGGESAAEEDSVMAPARDEPQAGNDSAATPAQSSAAQDTSPSTAEASPNGKAEGGPNPGQPAPATSKTNESQQQEKLPPTPDPAPDEMISVDTEPQPKNVTQIKRQITKPSGATASGTVYLKLLIDREGHYKKHVVRKSPSPALTEAVVQQVKNIRYVPAQRNGKPVKFWVSFAYSF